MTPSQVEAIQQAFAHHKAGALDRAAAAYEAILEGDPRCAEAWHLYGAVALQKGDATLAVDRLERAVACDGKNAQYRYNLSVALKGAGRLADAAAELRTAHTLAPDSFDILNNLGLIEKELGHLDAALEALTKALGLAPANPASYNNLALVVAALGETVQAEDLLRRAIELKPDYAEAYNNLGAALMKQGRLDEAEAAFRKALDARPGYGSAVFNLAGLLHAAHRLEEAAACYRSLLEIDPDNAVARHLLNALEGAPSDSAPAEYVAHLFDGYAGHFEAHLIGTLGYDAPAAMRALWDELGCALPEGAAVVDLGCGTGLCARAFADLGGTVTGVDISERMVDEATASGLYARVVHGDVLGFLDTLQTGIDLALAGDMLIYLGDPTPLLSALGPRLAPGGVFICSIESMDQPGFVLRDTGRFAHNPDDLEALARAAGLEVAGRRQCHIRQGSDGKPIEGFVLALARPA